MTNTNPCCRRCAQTEKCPASGLPIMFTTMVVCSECGNKRCPKATDHRHTCTGSNEPGQVGSDYR
ncbi:hypothetical protein [Marinobacter sp. MDS2]|uniref:hypothetical protein n=1 Tax=Marinobacter sp. MDS2 TaxID=3065961 RepID=UPI00273C20F3|nr:hypothetical protein [Marinobacter sp. MDS2]MDP4546507.1 hypothetical protein [Marinobacter sp. MDS2]